MCADTKEQEDPYQLRLFAKSPYKFDVVTAEFLPDGSNLYVVAVDSDGGIHVLQYDPDSKSPPTLPDPRPLTSSPSQITTNQTQANSFM